jgi:hypothetical protein
MLKVVMRKNEIEPALRRVLAVIQPRPILIRSLGIAKKVLKMGYAKKWRMAYPTGGGSLWSAMKGRFGFFTGLGFFTGTTYRSINYVVLNISRGKASGEVGPQGVWPQKPYGLSLRGEKNALDTEFTGMDWWTMDIGRDDPRLADSGARALSEAGLGVEQIQSTEDAEEYILVGPRGASIKYRASKSFRLPSAQMKTKTYGPKEATGGGVDFIYLTPEEENAVFDSVVRLVSGSVN